MSKADEIKTGKNTAFVDRELSAFCRQVTRSHSSTTLLDGSDGREHRGILDVAVTALVVVQCPALALFKLNRNSSRTVNQCCSPELWIIEGHSPEWGQRELISNARIVA